jgi:hypothetical protein
MTTYTVKPKNKKEAAILKKILKALNADFEINEDETPYNPEFVTKILKGDEEYKEGKTKGIRTSDLWK